MHCDSGDMIVLVCHVVSQDRVIKESMSCDFWVGVRQDKLPSCQVW